MTIGTDGNLAHAPDVEKRLQHASWLAKEAGSIALHYFTDNSNLIVERKGSQDWVSKADKKVEQFIRKSLNEAFPEDAVIGEEDGLSNSTGNNFLWIIDPIDGTTCFLKGIPQWCVVIALVKDNVTVATAIYDPVADELFTALKNHGAWCNQVRIQVDPTDSLTEGLVSVGTSVKLGAHKSARLIEKLISAGGMYSRIGSCAMGLAYVASGRLLGMYEPLIHPWDSWGGQLLVEEAGGTVISDKDGANFDRPGPTVATAPGVWEALERMLVG